MTGATVKVSASVTTADKNRNGSIYVAALYGNSIFFLDSGMNWVLFDGTTYPAFRTGALADSGDIVVAANTDLRQVSGAELYVGYGKGPGNGAAIEMLNARRYRSVVRLQ